MISNAIVIGGGIGGLAAATLLARRGVAVTLLEQAPALTEVGAGLQISPNGMAVLRAMGLQQSIRNTGAVQGQAVVLADYADGGQVARLDLTRLGEDQTYLFLHRADLINVLAKAARQANVTFEMGQTVLSVKPGPLPEVTLSDNSTRRAELVVAADGLHSVARPVLNGAAAPDFTGQVAWRALIPNSFEHPPVAQVTMGPGRHLVSYPVRDSGLVNLVAVEERADWAAEGWNHTDDTENLRAAFASFGGLAGRMISAVKDVTLWGLHRHPVANHWTSGNIALLGDAAHPTLPFLAQGANMALEDAWVMADVVGAGGQIDLSSYQTRRMQRVSRVINAANGNAWRYHLRPGPLRSAAHLGLRIGSRLAPGRMIGTYDWLYRHDVTKERT